MSMRISERVSDRSGDHPNRAPAKAGAQGGRRNRFWRWAPAFAGALVAACGTADEGQDETVDADPLAEAEADAQRELAENGLINCAVGGESAFRPICTIEQFEGEEGIVLTLRHPDGGFRRLLVTTDGRGVVAADGAEAAEVTPISDNQIEVAIAEDRYRLPATVR